VDPNKAPSEFNHHIAGWALIGVGILVLVSFLYPNPRSLRYFWPALFVLMGLFLALWSDAEMWPRGNMNWAWLLQHDREAGQHKIYALLLSAIGLVEYLRARGSLNRFWRAWAFPILAIVGAASLLVHDHTAGSGATSPEARAYLINPALGPDGKPPKPAALDPMPGMDHSTTEMDHSSMPMDHSSMDHSSMALGNDPAVTNTPSPDHHHHMTPSMLLVEREHFWFMIVGLGVALFKLISDGEFWRRRFVPYVWPGGMMVLGVLLVLYRE
jgi:cell division protein FtsW (lipid II flippase)